MDPILKNPQLENYDDSLPLRLHVPSLNTYVEDLRKLQTEEK